MNEDLINGRLSVLVVNADLFLRNTDPSGWPGYNEQEWRAIEWEAGEERSLAWRWLDMPFDELIWP